ncbi:MAG: hypothetical protein PHC31_13355, partial [Clostridia bacterium]|nr:hypothetical protein [Clostridia bacterium]
MSSKKILTLFLLFAAFCLVCISPVSAAGGSGTVGDPFIIQTPAELQAMQNNLDAYYELQNNIDLTGVTWTPVGNETSPFTGSLEGNGYTISDLSMNVDAYIVKDVGLFGVISGDCYLANTTLDSFEIIASASHGVYSHIGCLAGMATDEYNGITSTIYNIDVNNSYIDTPTASTTIYIGGLVGGVYYISSNIDISFCDINNCNLISCRKVGGLIGYIDSGASPLSTEDTYGDISNCTVSSTTITSDDHAGGLIGETDVWGSIDYGHTATLGINNCIVYLTSITSISEAGGVSGVIELGDSNLSITNCYVDSCNVISSDGPAGGFFGSAEPYDESELLFDNCVVVSTDISSNWYGAGGVGGLVYNSDLSNDFIITNSFVGDCNITCNEPDSYYYYSAGVIGIYEGYESPYLENIYIQNNDINGYIVDEIITLVDYSTEEPTIPLVTSNVFGSGNILNGYYHADLNEDIYLISVTDIGDAYSVTIIPPDTESYNVSTKMLAQSADYHTIGSTWSDITGTYTYSLSKTYAATAGYIAI